MDRWQYNAPLRVDFSSPLADADDRFFDRPTEYPLHEPRSQDIYEEYTKIEHKLIIKTEVKTPSSDNDKENEEYQCYKDTVEVKEEQTSPLRMGHRRRSMSVHAIMQTATQTKNTNGYSNHTNRENEMRYMKSLNRDNRTFSQSKLMGKSTSTCSLHSNAKVGGSGYIPTAEAIYYLQKDTPERFHTRSRNEIHRILETANRSRKPDLGPTIPQSPALLSKNRNRPIHVLSQKEIEDLEVEEMKRHKIKAQPISTAALLGISNLAPVQRRPTTQLRPFNLTEKKKHRTLIHEEKKEFKARPMPKHVFEKPFELVKKLLPITVPMSPKITRPKSRSLEHVLKPMPQELPKPKIKQVIFTSKTNINAEGMRDLVGIGHSGVPLMHKFVPQPCKPFSFERRDKDREALKQEKIQKFLKEEKELREFHANPLPKCIMKKNTTDTSHSTTDSKKENKENIDNKVHMFKAKPPIVLHKEPFVPIKSNRALLEPCQLELETDKRARDRDLFNKKLKEKEEMREMMHKLKEQEQREAEERQIAILRSQLVHKAAPIKHYPPVVVHPSDIPLTFPKSPNFASKNQ